MALASSLFPRPLCGSREEHNHHPYFELAPRENLPVLLYAWVMNEWSVLQQALDTYFCQRTDEQRFSGVVRITQGSEEVFGEAYGLASRTWGVPASMDTRFDTASLTKLFTAVATLQCIDRGAFALDTPVIPYLGLQNTTISDEVTVFHLLTHSSGIGDDSEEEDGEDYADLWKTKPNYSILETVDFLPQFASKPRNFPPGERCRYCNCGFVLLGLMIEKASGMSYRAYVRQHIFAPAGMKDSAFFSMDQCTPNVAEGCDAIRDKQGDIEGWHKNIYSYPIIGSPDSGAHVTAADLDRFLRAVRKNVLTSKDSAKRFFTPQISYKQREGWEMQYGLGMWFYVESDGHVVCCQKEGYNAGVSAVMRYFPDSDINVIILSNMAEGAWEPAWHIHELIIDALDDSSTKC